ncbi:MAG: helix-turn-helix domain-containing protein [Bacteroidota bacterium]
MIQKNLSISENIIHYRKIKGLTQEELANLCQLSVRTIQRMEAASVDPRLHTLKVIASALEVSMDTFVQPLEKKDRNSLVALHLTSLAYFVFPFGGNIIGPLIFWIFKKDKVDHVYSQGKDLMNAQISYSIYQLLCFLVTIKFSAGRVFSSWITLVSIVFIPSGLLLCLVIVLPLIKAYRLHLGKEIRPYPLKIKFIR